MNTLRPGDFWVYPDSPQTTYRLDATRVVELGTTYHLDAKRVVELGTLVDATLFFLMRKAKDNDGFFPVLVVKITDHEKSETVYVEYPASSEAMQNITAFTEEHLAMDALMASTHGDRPTSLGGVPLRHHPYDQPIQRINHEMQPVAPSTQSKKRILVDEDMAMGDFMKRVLLLPEHYRGKALQQQVVEPLDFKKRLGECPTYCANKSAMVRDVLFQYDFLSGVVSARSLYLKALCKTILILGEKHDHTDHCHDVLSVYQGARSASVADIVEDCMGILRSYQDCVDDPPMLCMVEASPYFNGAHDMDVLRDDDEDQHAISTTAQRTNRLDARALVHIDLRDELHLYVIKAASRMSGQLTLGRSQMSSMHVFLTHELPSVLDEFLPFRHLLPLVPFRVQQYVRDHLEREMRQHQQDPAIQVEFQDGTESCSLTKAFDDTLALVMDLYTLCKIISSTQNFIIVHEGDNHAVRLSKYIADLFWVDEKMEISSDDLLTRVVDAYFFHHYPDVMRTGVEPSWTPENEAYHIDKAVAPVWLSRKSLSCLPLSNKADVFSMYMARIRRGDPLQKVLHNDIDELPDSLSVSTSETQPLPRSAYDDDDLQTAILRSLKRDNEEEGGDDDDGAQAPAKKRKS